MGENKMSGIALVTGSGKKRVGFAVAKALASKGYDLALHYRSSKEEAEESAKELRTLGRRVEAFPADLSQETDVMQLTEAIFQSFGQVNVLVNCAAVWPRKALEEVTASDVRFNFDTNTLGTFLMCQQIGLHMVKQDSGGVIINLGDWAEARPYVGYSAYFPSKAAIPGLTRCFAVELGSRNPKVRVNAVLPGPVMLPPDLPDVERQEAIVGTLVKREGSPNNIAQAVLSLIENDFITGVCLPIDGGRTIYAQGF
jgi:pteridine reductase